MAKMLNRDSALSEERITPKSADDTTATYLHRVMLEVMTVDHGVGWRIRVLAHGPLPQAPYSTPAPIIGPTNT
jgi:hypothetical protein